MLYQQGDVLIEPVACIPEKGKTVARKSGKFIIAEGEATGHTHAIADDVNVFEHDGVLYCKSDVAFTITHEEHHPITIPSGIYRFRRVREYDHFAEEAREVID